MAKVSSTLGTAGLPGHYVGAVCTPAAPIGAVAAGNVVVSAPTSDNMAFYQGGNSKNIVPDVGVKGGQTPEPAHE